MAKIQIYSNDFKKLKEEETSLDLSKEVISVPTVHQVVKATLAGRRQGTACTKNRSAVRGGGAKPFKQKGTGRARQGSSRSPLNVGGGVTFGPTPRDFSQKVNKKMMKKAIQSVLADKNIENSLIVVENFKSDGKTQALYDSLMKNDMLPALIVASDENDKVLHACSNLERGKGLPVKGFSVYEAVKFKNLIIDKTSFDKLAERLG